MVTRLLFCTLSLLCFTRPLAAQADEETLFTVDGRPVTVGEFRYIYGKTNGEEADFSRQSVQEYLDLYERFKLKVARARAMGLDTVAVLQQELEGYRRQLADNYLLDRRVTDPLVEELYERSRQDIEIHHILFALNGNASPADTLAQYRRALAAREGLTADNFAARAADLSEDTYSKQKGGRIGYVTAPFPKGLYQLEDALYPAGTGTIVGPVRTRAGYHLAMKTAARPARGEVEVAHILVRKKKDADEGQLAVARAKIEEAQKELEAGKDFAQVAARFSEDGETKSNGGYIGFFGINRYEPAFEDAAFGLTADDEVSDIVESRAGYHLIRRISRPGIQPLKESRPLLENKVKADTRFADAKQAMIEDIRRRAEFEENPTAFGRYASQLVDSVFFDYRWSPGQRVAKGDDVQTLGQLGGAALTLADYEDFLRRNARRRVSMARRTNAYGAAEQLYREWLDKKTMDYAEARLEEDFPEFRALMREYREGILLFEATKLEVWDKASADTTGLKAYFNAHRDQYRFPNRAVVTVYRIDRASDLNVNEVVAFARNNGAEATLEKFGRRYLTTEEVRYDQEQLQEAAPGTEFRPGMTSRPLQDVRKAETTFYKVESIEPARRKELSEARGYVIADYQDELERKWVEGLREQFPVQTNKKVLSKLMK